MIDSIKKPTTMHGISRTVENDDRHLPYTSSGRCDRSFLDMRILTAVASRRLGPRRPGCCFRGALMRRSAEGDENLFLVWLHWKEVSKRVDRGRDALELSLLEQVRS